MRCTLYAGCVSTGSPSTAIFYCAWSHVLFSGTFGFGTLPRAHGRQSCFILEGSADVRACTIQLSGILGRAQLLGSPSLSLCFQSMGIA